MAVNTYQNVVCHLIYRFDIGGLERVMVNCINAMQDDNYEHVVIALTEIGDFSKHLSPTVKTFQLNKKSGKDLSSHWRLFKLLRQIKPDILHTYNLAALEYHPMAKLAGVKGHIHAEHGREISDPLGLNKKHNFLRKLISPFIHYFVAVSSDLHAWLIDVVNIDSSKVRLVHNGIDIEKFSGERLKSQCIRFIHIARFNPVKGQHSLINAFALLVEDNGYLPEQVSLTLVGDGELTSKLKQLVSDKQLNDFVIFTGARNDIPELLSQADVFVLSSIAEGIPMTVLEAMAASLPIISTNVGGLSELVEDGVTGLLVEKQNTKVLANAMYTYVNNPQLIEPQGKKAHQFIEQNFSETAMIKAYLNLYQHSLGQ
jgi:sugar transferase (PEP-CTERM/EpsH1 system associated)